MLILGGSIYGLATAHYLSEVHGIKNAAVLVGSDISDGDSGPDTVTVR